MKHLRIQETFRLVQLRNWLIYLMFRSVWSHIARIQSTKCKLNESSVSHEESHSNMPYFPDILNMSFHSSWSCVMEFNRTLMKKSNLEFRNWMNSLGKKAKNCMWWISDTKTNTWCAFICHEHQLTLRIVFVWCYVHFICLVGNTSLDATTTVANTIFDVIVTCGMFGVPKGSLLRLVARVEMMNNE